MSKHNDPNDKELFPSGALALVSVVDVLVDVISGHCCALDDIFLCFHDHSVSKTLSSY